MRDWILTPSPYFFPDLATQALLQPFSSYPQVSTAAVMVLQPLAGVVLVAGLFRSVSAPGVGWFGLLLACLILGFANRWSDVAQPFLVLSYHGGQAVLGMGCLWLALSTRRRAFAWLCGFSLLGALSDPIFVVSWAAPSLILIFGTRPSWSARASHAAALCLANGLGLVARSWLPLSPQLGGLINLERTRSAWAIYSQSISSTASLIMIGAWAASFFALFLVWKNARQRLLVLALLASIVATLLGLLMIGAPTRLPDARYLSGHTLALLSATALALGSTTSRSLVVFLGTLFTLFAGIGAWRALGTADFRLRPAPVACIDAARERLKFDRCVAGYWASKPLMTLANPPLVAMQVKPDGTPDWFISTRRHFPVPVDVDCAVFPDGEVARFISLYGAGSFQERCDGFTLLVYQGDQKAALNAALRPRLDQPAIPSPFF